MAFKKWVAAASGSGLESGVPLKYCSAARACRRCTKRSDARSPPTNIRAAPATIPTCVPIAAVAVHPPNAAAEPKSAAVRIRHDRATGAEGTKWLADASGKTIGIFGATGRETGGLAEEMIINRPFPFNRVVETSPARVPARTAAGCKSLPLHHGNQVRQAISLPLAFLPANARI